jgi:hypothetical protein
MTSKKPKETIQPQTSTVQPPQDLSEGTNDITQTPIPSESSEKTQKSEIQQSTRTKVRYFKNTNITSLSFVSKDGRMHTFIDGVFRTDDPVVIEWLKGTQDYQYGFIKEFDPSRVTDED